MFQIALRQIDDFCQEHNLSIIGYYESPNINKTSANPSPFAEKVGDKLREQCKEAFLFTNRWNTNAEQTRFDIAPYVKQEVSLVHPSLPCHSVKGVLYSNLDFLKNNLFY